MKLSINKTCIAALLLIVAIFCPQPSKGAGFEHGYHTQNPVVHHAFHLTQGASDFPAPLFFAEENNSDDDDETDAKKLGYKIIRGTRICPATSVGLFFKNCGHLSISTFSIPIFIRYNVFRI